MRKFYQASKLLLLLVLLLSGAEVWSQTVRITGRVTSSDDGSALPGVSILEKGTTNGTVTDSDGNYSISVSANGMLVYSFVGYTSQEVSIAGRTTVDVTLQTDVTALAEVVVVGYGQQERKDVTGSLTAVSTKEFNKGVLSSPQDLLVGRVAGVSVISNNGAPGAGAQIRIRAGSSLRASNDPLIVIDGFPVDNNAPGGSANPLAAINPNDIESFTVLKDASATAIYGLRASNGVILITTKKGSSGKPQINYNGNVSLSLLAKKVDVLNANEYKAYINQKVAAGSVSGLGTSAVSRLGEANTDWQKEIYGSAVSHDHNVNVSGTYGLLPYRVSVGHTNQQGILKTTDFKRNSLNLSLTPSFLDDKLRVNANLKSAWTNHNYGNESAVGSAVTFDPTQLVRNGNHSYGGYFTWTQLASDVNGVMNPDGDLNNIAPSNPVALLEQTNNTSDVSRYIGNIQLDYRFDFLPELTVNINTGFDYQKVEGVNNQDFNAAFTMRNGPGGSFTTYSNERKSELFDLYFNYLKNISGSKIDVTAGYSFQSFERNGNTITRIGEDLEIIEGEDRDDNGELDAPLTYISDPNTLLSIFGRLNYSLKDKYLATVTLRNDYSSRFSKQERSGIFPAASIGWRIANENFMANVNSVSDLKLRASFGITGQQDITSTDPRNPNPYPYLTRYQRSTNTAQYQFGDQFYYTLRPAPYDADIKWETTSTLNVGFDFGLFNDKVTGTVDVFNRKTRDLIGEIPVAAGSTFSNYLITNVGDMEIKGYEISLNFNPIRRKDLDVNFGVNFTSLDAEITKLTKTDDPEFFVPTGDISGGVGNKVQRHAVGQAPSSFHLFQQVYTTDGMPIEGLYVDRTGLGGSVISDENNRRYNQKPMADYLIGLNSRVNYKNFDFSFSSRISLGNYVYNNVLSSNAVNNQLYNQSGFFSNVPSKIKETDFNAQQLWSDQYLENASFFKLDNVSLGYTLNNIVNNKLKARFSLTGQNLLVITKYSGIDPEHANGIDNNLYPRPRTILFGINLTY